MFEGRAHAAPVELGAPPSPRDVCWKVGCGQEQHTNKHTKTSPDSQLPALYVAVMGCESPFLVARSCRAGLTQTVEPRLLASAARFTGFCGQAWYLITLPTPLPASSPPGVPRAPLPAAATQPEFTGTTTVRFDRRIDRRARGVHDARSRQHFSGRRGARGSGCQCAIEGHQRGWR